jgi:hypothetical protein
LAYVLSSSGVALNLHYCGGRLAHVEIIAGQKHKCKCGSKKMAKSCCKNEQRFLKVKDTHKVTASVSITEKFSVHLFITQTSDWKAQRLCSHAIAITSNHFPPIPPTDICLRNSVFRI